MAITPTSVASLLNTTLENLGYEFRVRSDTEANFNADVEAIGAFPPEQLNKIMEQMNLVVQQRQFATVFDSTKNPWREFLINLSEEGFGIMDVYQELLEGTTPLWDGNGTDAQIYENLVARDDGDVRKKMHITPFEKQFKITVDARNYSKVFMRSSMNRFIDYRLGNLSYSAEVYLMQDVLINLVKQMISDEKIKASENTYNINTSAGIRNLIENVKAATDGMLLPSALYNYDEITSITPSKNDIFYITTPDILQRLKVQSAWGAYNLSEAELNGHFILAPNGTDFGDLDGNKVLLVALDRRALVCGLKYWLGSSFFVPNTHYVNHWLTVEGVQGYNTFINAMAFTGEELGNFIEDSADIDDRVLVVLYSTSGFASGDTPKIKVNGEEVIAQPYGDSLDNMLTAHIIAHKGDTITPVSFAGQIDNFKPYEIKVGGNNFVALADSLGAVITGEFILTDTTEIFYQPA